MSWADVKPELRALAAQTLTRRQLRVLQHKMDGHSWDTIATALGITKATAREHYKRAGEKLAEAMKREAA